MTKKLILLIAILFVTSFVVAEIVDENGILYEKQDNPLRAHYISIDQLFVLKPISEPAYPETGAIYFDAASKKLRFFDGFSWKNIAFEGSEMVSQQPSIKNSTVLTSNSCSNGWQCNPYGDCINSYQTRICTNIKPECIESKPEEIQSCEEEFTLSGPAGSQTESSTESENPQSESESQIETPSEASLSPETSSESAPEQLFDVTFEIENTILANSRDLQAIITLQDFGTKYIPARLIYTIFNENNQLVYQSMEETRVYTEQSIIKDFNDLSLDYGKYNIHLEVQYAGISENFEQTFEIKQNIWQSLSKFFRGIIKK